MPETKTVDADGGTLTTLIEPRRYTISYEKKEGRVNYGNESVFLSAQVPIADGTSAEVIEKEIREEFAFIKTLALRELGTPFGQNQETGVVAPLETHDVRAAAPTRKPQYAKKASGGQSGGRTDRTADWQHLVDNFGDYYDNRENKRNPNGPDFKHKQNGTALWLNTAPQFALDFLNGGVI